MKVVLWGEEWAEEAPGHDCRECKRYERGCYFVEHSWRVKGYDSSVARVGSNCFEGEFKYSCRKDTGRAGVRLFRQGLLAAHCIFATWTEYRRA
jgi:hypothetical protein